MIAVILLKGIVRTRAHNPIYLIRITSTALLRLTLKGPDLNEQCRFYAPGLVVPLDDLSVRLIM